MRRLGVTGLMVGLVVELFAGGGGASNGIKAALGRSVDIAINHNPVAIAVHKDNHPDTEHFTTDVWEVDPIEATKGRPVDVLWASPDCTFFSRARGGKPRKKRVRSLAWVVTRWAKAVRPREIYLENVPEFQDWGPLLSDNTPCKKRRGKTFRAWVARLRNLGYAVEWRVIDASNHGVRTSRKRLYIMARCDGEQIVWPTATHGKGGKPLRQAAECIDWSLPCPSIFQRKKPLAEKTMWRIAQGLRRFVFEADRPFIVGDAATFLQHSGNGEREGQRARSLDIRAPLTTVMATGQKHALVAAWLVKHFGDPLRADGGGGVVAGSSLNAPLGTVTGRDHHSLAVVTLEALHERNGSSSEHGGTQSDRGAGRRHDLEAAQPEYDAPADAAPPGDSCEEWVPSGPRERELAGIHAVGSPFGLDRLEGSDSERTSDQSQGRKPEEQPPIQSGGRDAEREHAALIPSARTKTAHSGDSRAAGGTGLGAPREGANLLRDRKVPRSEPDDCVSSRDARVAKVRAFLATFYGNDKGQQLTEPLRTQTARHRFGLVVVEGVEYQVVDIGFRMLEPPELAKAQFGRFADGYDLSAARTKKDKIFLIGNSVCSEMAERLLLANHRDRAREAA